MFDRKALRAEARRRMALARPRFWSVMAVWFLAAVLAPAVIEGVAWESLETFYLMLTGTAELPLWLALSGDDVMVGMFLTLVLFLYSLVLAFGPVHYALKLWRGEACSHGVPFQGFSMVWRVIGAQLLMALFTWLWSVALLIPVTLVAALAVTLPTYVLYAAVMSVCLCLWAGAVIALRMRYAMTLHILSDRPDLGPLAAVRGSKELMRGYLGQYFLLGLSFAGWMVLLSLPMLAFSVWLVWSEAALHPAVSGAVGALASLPLCLWLTPYMETSFAGFYDTLAGPLRLEEERPTF